MVLSSEFHFWFSHWHSTETQLISVYWPCTQQPGVHVHWKTDTKMSTATLFIITTNWKQWKFPSTLEWIQSYKGILHRSEKWTAAARTTTDDARRDAEQRHRSACNSHTYIRFSGGPKQSRVISGGLCRDVRAPTEMLGALHLGLSDGFKGVYINPLRHTLNICTFY